MGWNGYPSESATLTKAPKIGRLEGTTPNGGEMLKETSWCWEGYDPEKGLLM
jgi:hypothetical protein